MGVPEGDEGAATEKVQDPVSILLYDLVPPLNSIPSSVAAYAQVPFFN